MPRIFINGSDGTIKVAPAGTDVTRAGDDDLNFNSSLNVFKVVAVHTLTIPALSLNTGGANYAVGTSQTVSVPHGLNHIPAILAFWADATGYVQLPWTRATQFGAGGFSYTEYHSFSTETEVGVSGTMSGFNISTTNPTTSVKIYVLQETAN